MSFTYFAGELDEHALAGAIPALAAILVDAVESGASVGFELPFSREDAERWWSGLIADAAAGRIVVIAARDGERIVGTAQLRLAQMPNQRHRADVAKVLVPREQRRRGIGALLMGAIEYYARQRGRTLLVLDTISGSDAARLYERLGWQRVGEIPRYATMPDGTLAPTTFYYKELSR